MKEITVGTPISGTSSHHITETYTISKKHYFETKIWKEIIYRQRQSKEDKDHGTFEAMTEC